MLPSDPARAKLYIMWKRALAEREELLKQARRRKHELMKDLKARHESQVVLLELERRAAVETLRESVRTEQEREERHRVELAAVEESIQHAEAAMDKYVAVGGRVWVRWRRRRPSFTPFTSPPLPACQVPKRVRAAACRHVAGPHGEERTSRRATGQAPAAHSAGPGLPSDDRSREA